MRYGLVKRDGTYELLTCEPMLNNQWVLLGAVIPLKKRSKVLNLVQYLRQVERC